MGDETHRGHLLRNIGRNTPHDVSVFVERSLYAEIIQLPAKEFQEILLLVCRGLGLGVLVALGVHPGVPQEAVQEFFHISFAF